MPKNNHGIVLGLLRIIPPIPPPSCSDPEINANTKNNDAWIADKYLAIVLYILTKNKIMFRYNNFFISVHIFAIYGLCLYGNYWNYSLLLFNLHKK